MAKLAKPKSRQAKQGIAKAMRDRGTFETGTPTTPISRQCRRADDAAGQEGAGHDQEVGRQSARARVPGSSWPLRGCIRGASGEGGPRTTSWPYTQSWGS